MSCQSVNYYDGTVLKTFEDLTDRQLESALVAAADCSEAWRSRSLAERAKVFVKAAGILTDRLDDFAHTVTLEMGKLLDQSRGEVALCAHILAYYAKSGAHLLASRHLKPNGRDTGSNPGADVGALGILFGVEPWNFPYYQLTRFAAPNLMAGNVVMVKHAERVPQCASDFANLWLEAGAPAGAFTNLLISPEQVNRVIEDPRIKGVALTGRVHAGKQVANRVDLIRRRSAECSGKDGVAANGGLEFDHTIQWAVWSDLPGYYGPRIS